MAKINTIQFQIAMFIVSNNQAWCFSLLNFIRTHYNVHTCMMLARVLHQLFLLSYDLKKENLHNEIGYQNFFKFRLCCKAHAFIIILFESQKGVIVTLLRTRRGLMLYKVYGINSALSVFSVYGVNALLVLTDTMKRSYCRHLWVLHVHHPMKSEMLLTKIKGTKALSRPFQRKHAQNGKLAIQDDDRS